MMGYAPDGPGFVRLGPAQAETPVVLAVPHAGRDYPASLLAAVRVPLAQLGALEDRHADALVLPAVAAGVPAFVARRARAWIDLNRSEKEIDPDAVDPRPPLETIARSGRSESGLGLVPTRLPGGGHILARPIAAADLAARIVMDHRPYHAALAADLADARARFGAALLIDIHSMPPISAGRGPAPAIVLGDRHGRTAAIAVVAAIAAELRRSGLRVASNVPYAGAYTLDRHGRPRAGIHAIQIEIDRTLYLAPGLRDPGTGLEAIGQLLARVAAVAAAALPVRPHAIAAE